MARALDRAGLLNGLVTKWCFTAEEARLAGACGLPAKWVQRSAPALLQARLTRAPLADLRRCLGRLFRENSIQAGDRSFDRVDRVGAALLQEGTGVVLAREDAALRSFEVAAHLGLPRVYILPTPYVATVKGLVDREAAEFPEAFCKAELAADFAPERLLRKKVELVRATHIFCMSSFVEQSVRQAAHGLQTFTLPLGADTSWSVPVGAKKEPVFLYAGNISARKGVHRLLRAWKRLKAYRTYRLRLIGGLNLPRRFLTDYRDCFEHQPWMPRHALVCEYVRASAFVFNALADGFGNVLSEAMACGTPVLASRNCGAPDVVTNEKEGLLFDYGDDAQLENALDWALSNPSQLAEMGECARERVSGWSWEHFAGKFRNWIGSIMGILPPGPVQNTNAPLTR